MIILKFRYLYSQRETFRYKAVKILTEIYNMTVDRENPIRLQYRTSKMDIFAYGSHSDFGRQAPSSNSSSILTRESFQYDAKFRKTYLDVQVTDVFPRKLCPFANGSVYCPANIDVNLNSVYASDWKHSKIPFKLDCWIKPWNLWKIWKGPTPAPK